MKLKNYESFPQQIWVVWLQLFVNNFGQYEGIE